MTSFKWTSKRESAAIALASGHTIPESAAIAGVSESSISRWKRDLDFAAEVDRLSLMIDISSRAERLRIAMRAARQAVKDDGTVDTSKDILDWLRFAQSETDGARLDLTRLMEAINDSE